MKILVVEDNPEKLRQVLNAISRGGASDRDVSIAHDTREAKLVLKEHQFDLMVLDLVLPTHPAEAPRQDAGINLLQEVQDRALFRMPREVVGLTAYDEIREEATDMFGQFMWSILQFDPTSESWSLQLTRKVSHLLLAERAEDPVQFGCDACVITALPLELDAVLRIPWKWTEFERPTDVTMYWRGEFPGRDGERTVFAASAPRMGMTAAAILSTKMIEAFRPKLIVMTGIAAGIRGRCELGDVIVADPSWDWESGKHSVQNGVRTFSPAPHQISLSSSIRLNIDRLRSQRGLLDNIKRSWPSDGPSSSLSIRSGPVACGTSVLADSEKIAEIESQHRKVIAVEMESYGLYSAVTEARVPQPLAVSLKSVCDFADEAKSDAFQRYAAFTSAQTMKALLETTL